MKLKSPKSNSNTSFSSKKHFVHKPEGKPLCDWTVIDAGHVLVHIFRNEVREVYDLEKLWSEDFTNINTAS